MLFRFSSEDFLPTKRSEAARDAYASLAQIDITPVGDDPFRSRMSALALDTASVGRIDNSPCRVSRSQRHIANGNDAWVLYIVTEGRVSVHLRGHEERVFAAGEAYLAPNDLPGEFDLDAISHVQIAVPRDVLEPRLAPAASHTRRTFRFGQSAELQYLARYAGMLTSLESAPTSLGTLASDHLVDLLALVLGARDDHAELAGGRGLREARLLAVLSEMKRAFCDPTLSAQAVGDRLGISARYVQSLVQQTGMSFSERVLELRLNQAHLLLTRDAPFTQIRQIAYACGFSDAAYFDRCFRRRFGETPTQARSAEHSRCSAT